MQIQKDITKITGQLFSEILKYAEGGDSEAQFVIGKCLIYGIPCGNDYERGFAFAKLSAEQGNADGQNLLGQCFENGWGETVDETSAIEWYQKAAEQGNVNAQYRLGELYKLVDRVKAFEWYQMAAEQGCVYAQDRLASSYECAYGVKKDLSKAAYWSIKAAEQGDSIARRWLSLNIDRRSYCAEKSKIFNCLLKLAESGDSYAQHSIGDCYYQVDKAEAFKWYQRSAVQGNRDAQYDVGLCYFNGIGVDMDKTEAEKWFKKAAAQYHLSAITKLYRYYC